MKIASKQSENCKHFKDVYINGEIVGTTMADDTMTAFDCYENLKVSWSISEMELQNDFIINNTLNY